MAAGTGMAWKCVYADKGRGRHSLVMGFRHTLPFEDACNEGCGE